MLRRILLASMSCAMAFGPGSALAACNYFVQLASVKSDASAHQEWARLQKAHPDLFGDLPHDVQRADRGAGGISRRTVSQQGAGGPRRHQWPSEDSKHEFKNAIPKGTNISIFL